MRPLSSPWVMMTAPMRRVVEPQEVWMGILQFVVPTGEGYVIGAGELVAKVVAGARLEGLAVLHHGLDGVGGFGAGELFLVGLAAA